MATLHLGDCRDVLATMPDDSIDAIVTDPPYELGFMGKSWDASGIAYDVTMWRQCLRVLKPGGHVLAFGGSRTYHRMAVAIEDAGFEIRDCIMWIYGSGFPKSLDVSKAMDKQAGAEREVVTESRSDMFGEYEVAEEKWRTPSNKPDFATKWGFGANTDGNYTITAPATDLAKQWQGWGTALKPAHEPIVMARKPLTGTVADNVGQWGVGALNIDGTRIGDGQGRWPANVIFDEDAAEALDVQSGVSGGSPSREGIARIRNNGIGLTTTEQRTGVANSPDNYGDIGGASRFFYVAKASKAEREAGLEGHRMRMYGSYAQDEWSRNNMKGSPDANREPRANHHPTVKPIALMRYLVRLVTPKGGIVLDPFTGSGTTGCAAVLEGMDFVGIEQSAEYLAIADARIAHHGMQLKLDL